MEIIRNDREARVSFATPKPEDILSVTFENTATSVKFVFGVGEPVDPVAEGDRYIDYDTGLSYELTDTGWVSRGQRFNSLINSIAVPTPFITYCGKFNVRWEYFMEDGFGDRYYEVQQHTVVQPLFTAAELKDFDPDFETMNVSDNAIKRLERVIRAVIERSTGQKFELSYGIQTGRSYNGESLMLPKRAVALEGYSGYISGVKSRIDSDGWILRAVNPHSSITNINANPIYDVYSTSGFSKDRYTLRGEWGYRSVPEQIQLAAMLLAQDYGCRESVWRDRYIEMMKNVDWSIQYHDKAFEGTGNIKVDQILQSYTVSKWAVV